MGALYCYYHLFSQNFTGRHDNERTTKFVEEIKKVQEKAKAALTKAQEDMRRYVDRHRAEAVGCEVGDLVLFSTRDLKWQMVG